MTENCPGNASIVVLHSSPSSPLSPPSPPSHRSSGSCSEAVTFDLKQPQYVPLFRRLLAGLEATFRNVLFDLCPDTCCLKMSSLDWNSFTGAQSVVGRLVGLTVDRGLSWSSGEYEDLVNEELSRAKVPKKHLLGKLRDVFIDCNNVATAHGHGKFSWAGVKIACEFFEGHGHNVVMIVPTHRKKQIATPAEREFVENKEKCGELKYVSSQSSDRRLPFDDGFLLQSCAELDGVLLSNDRFQDFADDLKLRHVIQNRVIPYLFIKDTLIIGSDTFNKRKVDCDRLLVRTSPYQEEVERMSAMPCPYGERCNYGKKCKYLHQQQQESRGARARRLNRTLGSKTRFERGRQVGDQSSGGFFRGSDSRDGSYCENRFQKLSDVNPVSTTANANIFSPNSFWRRDGENAVAYNREESEATPVRKFSGLPNSDSLLPNHFSPERKSPEWNKSSSSFGEGNVDDGQFDMEFQNPLAFQGNAKPPAYNLWSGPNFELSPSKSPYKDATVCGTSHWLAGNGVAKEQHFSYFSDSGSSCDDFMSHSLELSPGSSVAMLDQKRGSEEMEIVPAFITVDCRRRWSEGRGDISEKSQGIQAKPASNSAEVDGASFATVVGSSQLNGNETERTVSKSSCSSDCESSGGLPARNWANVSHSEPRNNEEFAPKTTDIVNGSENSGERQDLVKAKLEDYQSVMQILLDKSKQAHVLAVMKRHPEFTREQILVHIWNIGSGNCEGAEGKEQCCASLINEAREFIPSCYRLVGCENDCRLASAFFSVHQQHTNAPRLSGRLLWQEVIKRMAFDPEQ